MPFETIKELLFVYTLPSLCRVDEKHAPVKIYNTHIEIYAATA